MKDEFITQLIVLNENLQNLTEALSHQSFWNSQLFAAILGASSAIIVLFVHLILKWRTKRNQRLEGIYNWMAEQIDFFDPKSLYKEASRTTYKSITKDKTGKVLNETPEKPIGDKMVIELRGHVKYWRFPSLKLRRLFKKYEESLLEFNNVNNGDPEKYKQKSYSSNKLFEKLKNLSFKKTGENEWTY